MPGSFLTLTNQYFIQKAMKYQLVIVKKLPGITFTVFFDLSLKIMSFFFSKSFQGRTSSKQGIRCSEFQRQPVGDDGHFLGGLLDPQNLLLHPRDEPAREAAGDDR